MKNIISFIKNLLGFENPEDSMIGLSSFKNKGIDYGFSQKRPAQKSSEPTLSTLLTRKQF